MTCQAARWAGTAATQIEQRIWLLAALKTAPQGGFFVSHNLDSENFSQPLGVCIGLFEPGPGVSDDIGQLQHA